MPNLVPLMKVQELCLDGRLTIHQIVRANTETRGGLGSLLDECSYKFEMYRQAMSTETFLANAWCGARAVCQPKVDAFAQCAMRRNTYMQELQHREQLGNNAGAQLPLADLQQAPPKCGRVKQDLEACVKRLSLIHI